MEFKKLFSTPAGSQALDSAMEFLQLHKDDVIHVRLRQVLKIIKANAEEIDRNCPINVGWIGDETINRIKELNVFTEDITDEIYVIAAFIYRFITEFDMSIQGELSMELRAFSSAVDENLNKFRGVAKTQVEYARQGMAAAIVKKIINTEEFGSLRNIATATARVESKIQDWNASLQATEQKATQLSEALEKHTRAFNFVGLHEGFADLADDIKGELKTAQWRMIGFGIAVLIPGLFELYLIWSKTVDLTSLSIPTLIATSLVVVALTLLILYFFRIALRKADACRAQLIQVRLRMSLCRFIQDYASYSSDIKSKNEGALEKFENLIFSGIVSSDEKLPSTFDGIEQLASLAKSVRGGG